MKKQKFIKKKYFKKGFTLVEMLVSISLFTVIATLSFSALNVILDANNKAKAVKSVIGNISTAMESMSRELRVGYKYTCGENNITQYGENCPNGAEKISFTSQKGQNITYELDGENIKRTIGDDSAQFMTSDVRVEKLDFYVIGAGSGSRGNTQPRVLIVLKATSTKGGIDKTFHIQTTVSQRNPNN